MPDESYWTSFFDAEKVVAALFGPDGVLGDTVEFGCGYGTFTLPAARRTLGLVTALDIEPEMVASVCQRAEKGHLANIRAEVCDFVSDGTGLDAASQAHAMIYNLLHLEDPVGLLREARRVLAATGSLSVIHWRIDIATPRGPSLDIRPRPEICAAWMSQAGFPSIESINLADCAPYHFGLVGRCG